MRLGRIERWIDTLDNGAREMMEEDWQTKAQALAEMANEAQRLKLP